MNKIKEQNTYKDMYIYLCDILAETINTLHQVLQKNSEIYATAKAEQKKEFSNK